MIYRLEDREPQLKSSDFFIAESARIIGAVRIGHQASVWFNAILRGDDDWIEIGDRSNVQDGVVIHCDPGARPPSSAPT